MSSYHIDNKIKIPVIEANINDQSRFLMAPKYPDVVVELTDQNSNAFHILGLCKVSAQKAGLSQAEIEAFFCEATSGDYSKLIQTATRWFNCS